MHVVAAQRSGLQDAERVMQCRRLMTGRCQASRTKVCLLLGAKLSTLRGISVSRRRPWQCLLGMQACGKRSSDRTRIESRGLLVRNAGGTASGCRGRRHAVEAAEPRPSGRRGHQLCPLHRQPHSDAMPAEQLPQSGPGRRERIGQPFQVAADLQHAQPAVHASCTRRRSCSRHIPRLAHSRRQPMDRQCCADPPRHRHTRQQAARAIQQQQLQQRRSQHSQHYQQQACCQQQQQQHQQRPAHSSMRAGPRVIT